MKYLLGFTKSIVVIIAVAGLAAVGYFSRDHWLPLLTRDEATADASSTKSTETAAAKKIILTDQAIANLGLVAESVLPQTYWKTIQVPGMVVDRPGRSDRGIVSPVSGVITKVNFFPGDTVKPGEPLFSIRLLSESLHQTQSDLFKATQDKKLAEAKRLRLTAATGSLPEARLIEVDNDITRLDVAIKAYWQALSNRGFDSKQIANVTKGNFVPEIAVTAPPAQEDVKPLAAAFFALTSGKPEGPTFEVQELKVDLGQQVVAGQTLCLLANHRRLAIEGRAFRDETPLLQRSVAMKWPVEIDFGEPYPGDREALLLVSGSMALAGDAAGLGPTTATALLCLGETDGWFPPSQNFVIQHLANTIDPVNRTFGFRIPLENQARLVVGDAGRTQLLWRYRPGQKLRILLRVDELKNVFVLPAEAVTRDGPEAFVFTQNVNTFERHSVRVLFQDRRHTVIANDGSLVPGSFVVQAAAAQLNRMVKAGSGDGIPKGYHIHADGSLHKNEDEGK